MSRYSLRETPRKNQLYDGMVETPSRGRRSTRTRTSHLNNLNSFTDPDDSSSAAEGTTSSRAGNSTTTRRSTARGQRRRDDDIDESNEGTTDEASYEPTPEPEAEDGMEDSNPVNGHANGNGNGELKPRTPGRRGRPSKKAAEKSAEAIALEKRRKEAVDGYIPGTDPKVDLTGEFEFGGSFGTLAMMVGFPLLMYYMWIGATYFGGRPALPEEGQTVKDFLLELCHLVYTGAFPSLRAFRIYWVFMVFEAVLYVTLPGVTAYGKPLLHEGGRQLTYFCNAYASFYFTLATMAALHLSGLFHLYTFIDEFGPLLSVAIISGFGCSIFQYVSAHVRGTQHRMTGYPIYDFFMGAELNPRIGIIDCKMFLEVRLPWFILVGLTAGAAARQYEQYGYVSGELMFLVMVFYLYANACAKGEECIVTTWDMYHEKSGFMFTFWTMAGVPFTYCHGVLYMANHPPSDYRWNPVALAALYVTYLCVYWVWDTANSQKNRFRQAETGRHVPRKTFPQLPWAYIENPKTLTTPQGYTILVDGWYGKARKLHYACDVFFALCWAGVCGFRSPFPWFYPVFFVSMIIHRVSRDIHKCRTKYGETWTEYERMVPYLFVPGVF